VTKWLNKPLFFALDAKTFYVPVGTLEEAKLPRRGLTDGGSLLFDRNLVDLDYAARLKRYWAGEDLPGRTAFVKRGQPNI